MMTKGEFKGMLSQLAGYYPHASVNINNILIPYYNVLGKYEDDIIRKAFSMAITRHRRYYPNAGELDEIADELARERKYKERMVREHEAFIAHKKACEDEMVSPEEAKAFIHDIISILDRAMNMDSVIGKKSSGPAGFSDEDWANDVNGIRSNVQSILARRE